MHLVLGAAGQLGRELCSRLPGEVHGLTRAVADLTRPDALWETLRGMGPAVVFNCAAHNYVDRAENEPQAAFAVNAWGVRDLAMICRDLGCTLVHFSTDYVFGLEAGRATPYAESDAPGPLSVYGLSKLAGEYFARSICPDHLVIRTCGLYGLGGTGGKGGNFVATMLRLADEGKPIRVVNDQTCTPSYTADIADAAVNLLATGVRGLVHRTNGGSCSWYEFAHAIFELSGVQARLTPISSRDYGAAAKRPAYSVLDSRLPPLRSWREALAAYLVERGGSLA